MSWYKKGTEGLEDSKKFQEEVLAGFGPRRFWLPIGKSAKVTFLDTEGFYFYEHNIKTGKMFEPYTCLHDFSECPLCEAGHRPSSVCAYTIIDHSEFTSEKTGKTYKHIKRLLVVKSAVINKLARRREGLDGNLTYGVFIFSRDKKEECATGEDIEFIKRNDKKDVLRFKPKDAKESDEEWLKPFDYAQLFAPKSIEELRVIAGQKAPVGAVDYVPNLEAPKGAEGVAEDDIEKLL
jgi:hypothetical protein